MDSPDVIRELGEALDQGRLGVLAGAGISVDSGFPTAWALIGDIMALGGGTDTERTAVLNSRVAFEAVMSELEFLGASAVLEQLFSTPAVPTPAHCLLATLAAEKRIDQLATTNFDTLLETALEHVDPGYAVEVPGMEDSPNPPAAVRVVKLHGSAHIPGTIAATLATVSSAQHQGSRRAAVGRVFTGDGCVLVIGYSCSDHFDIVPAIRALREPRRRVFWIDHAPADPPSLTVTRLEEHHAVFGGYEAFRVRCDARAFVTKLARAADVRLPGATGTSAPGWQAVLREWGESLDACDRHRMLAAILLRAGQYDHSRTRFAHAARAAQAAGDELRAIDCLTSKGYLESELGLAREALETQQAAAAMASRATHLKMIGATHANLGIALWEADRFEESLHAHLVSLGAAAALGDQRRLGSRLGNLANALFKLGRVEEARDAYRDSLRTARTCGDQYSVFTACLGHGTASTELGEWQAAEEMLATAHELAVHLGHEQGRAEAEAARTRLAERRG